MRAAGFVAALAMLWAMAGSGAAQGLNPSGLNAGGAPGGANDNRPIDIQADSGIEWHQDEQVYVARGNAVATRGTTEVHADTLTAHYRPAKGSGSGSNEIYRINADGHVLIKGETQTVVGDDAVYDVDQAVVIVTGKALKMTTATDVITARDSLEWYDQKQIGVARGDAVAIREPKHIRADILTAYMVKTKPAGAEPAKPGAPAAKAGAKPGAAPKKPPPIKAAATPGLGPLGGQSGDSKISRVDAQGHVVVSTATDIGQSDYGVYNADTGICTLLGHVVITRGPNAIRGQYAVMDLNNNVSHIMPAPNGPRQRVEGLFVRQDQTPGTADKPAPAGRKKP